MKSSVIYHRIKADKFFLLKSYLKDMLVMLVMIGLLAHFKIGLHLDLSAVAMIVVVGIAVINGLLISSFLHNSSHGNVGSKLVNRVVGEYCGYWVLYGFSNFVLVHMLHHQFSDKDLDPVNPKGMSFFTFLTAPMRYMIKTTKQFLYQTHGNKKNYQTIMDAQIAVFHLNLALRLVIWFLLLGKTMFFCFYLPGFLTIVSIFAHINYVCHRDLEDGSVEVVNLNHNLYFKIANFFTIGGYFHKSHHLNMKAFDPRQVAKRRSLPLSTIEKREFHAGSFFTRYMGINNVWGEGQKNRN